MVRQNFKKPKSKENLLNKEQISQILKYLDNQGSAKENLAFRTLLFTGMRVSEFLHFKKEWLINNEFIRIPEKQKCFCRECIKKGYWTPKTTEGARTIPVLSEIKPLLKAYFNNYKTILEFFPQGRFEIWQVLKNLGKKFKLNIFPHCLRSSFATILADKGLTELKMTSIMGWKTIAPATSYVKFSGKQLKKELEEKWETIT